MFDPHRLKCLHQLHFPVQVSDLDVAIARDIRPSSQLAIAAHQPD